MQPPWSDKQIIISIHLSSYPILGKAKHRFKFYSSSKGFTSVNQRGRTTTLQTKKRKRNRKYVKKPLPGFIIYCLLFQVEVYNIEWRPLQLNNYVFIVLHQRKKRERKQTTGQAFPELIIDQQFHWGLHKDYILIITLGVGYLFFLLSNEYWTTKLTVSYYLTPVL